MTIGLLITRFKSIKTIVDKVKVVIEKLNKIVLDKLRNDKIKKIILEIGCTTQPI